MGEYPKDLVANGPTRSSILIGTEDRRAYNETGQSRFVTIPYYVNVRKYFAGVVKQKRQYLVGFAGSSKVSVHCMRCLNGISPKQIRLKMLNELQLDCSQQECIVSDLSQLNV